MSHLSASWDSQPIGHVDPEDFYDFQVTRPVMEVTDG
ncbi:MAG: PAC2 family protein, partial [Streptosporangiaceae bacterium]